MSQFERYTGTDSYIASPELCQIVNVAIALRRPCWSGVSRTGKTAGPQYRGGSGTPAFVGTSKVRRKPVRGCTHTTRCSD